MAGIATFTKDGQERVAYTPVDVVQYEFEGWTRTDDAPTGPPPQSGRGSGRDAWAAYAQQHAIDVNDEMTREEIIAAVTDAGLVTE